MSETQEQLRLRVESLKNELREAQAAYINALPRYEQGTEVVAVLTGTVTYTRIDRSVLVNFIDLDGEAFEMAVPPTVIRPTPLEI